MARVTITFLNKNSNNLWTKSFRSEKSSVKAIKGIQSKTNNMLWDRKKSKGFKFGTGIKQKNLQYGWQ